MFQQSVADIPTSIPMTTTPENGAVAVSRTESVSARFGEDMMVTSIDADSLTLSANGRAVAGAVQFDAQTNTLSFASGDRLPSSATVVATVDGTVANLDGDLLGSDFRWSFTTESASWGQATALESGSGSVAELQLAANARGDSVAVWVQDQQVFASRFEAATGHWSGQERVAANAGRGASPQVAVDPEGNVVAVWINGSDARIYARRFNAGVGSWGSAVGIGNPNGEGRYPQVAMDSAGNAVAVWQQSEGSALNIYASRLAAGRTVWTGVERIDAHTDESHRPQIAMDASGNAVVAWRQRVSVFGNLNTYRVFANRMEAGTWQGQIAVGTGANSVGVPRVAVNSEGQAFAVWRQNDGGTQNIYASHAGDFGSWSGAEQIGTAGTSVTQPDVATDGRGNVFVVWRQYGSNGSTVQVNRFSVAWQGAIALHSSLESADLPRIAANSNGDAFVVWSQRDGSEFFTEARPFVASGGSWGKAARLSGASSMPFVPGISMSAAGDAVAVWIEAIDSRGDLFTSRYY
ncbi:Ig-like domain-containing protein [Marinobacter salinisoli]|uniref:Ig-like domain-containing protein n=1 Tax=Marinobacter salinisoli TaxID=2769486 RepID=A0ABX7MVD4_9GAMM|nr:Ig-like domain-containing protein [Marinobacter salinisoli]QSP96238.1 Ig-like domain-containing protein [Marinobacter salinisoli]